MIRNLVALMLTLALSACTALSVYTDFNPAAQFANYRTYSWSTTPEQVSPLLAQRIVDNIDMQLRAKGWNKVATGGDVAVAANVATRQEYYVNDYYGGPYWGGWGWGGWGGWGSPYSSIDVDQYTERSVVIDIYDAQSRRPIWHGVGSDREYRDKIDYAKLDRAVVAALAHFPPQPATATR